MAYTITRELSDKVVSIIHNITGEIVNIMVEGGRILSSSDPARIGTVHEGGARIMNREVSEIAITHEMAGTVKGAKPGYNGGIYYRNRLIGCLGIGGDPDVVKTPSEDGYRHRQRNHRPEEQSLAEKKLRDEAVSRINNIAENMTVLSLNGSIQAAKIGSSANGFKVVAVEMRNLAASINEAVEFFKKG